MRVNLSKWSWFWIKWPFYFHVWLLDTFHGFLRDFIIWEAFKFEAVTVIARIIKKINKNKCCSVVGIYCLWEIEMVNNIVEIKSVILKIIQNLAWIELKLKLPILFVEINFNFKVKSKFYHFLIWQIFQISFFNINSLLYFWLTFNCRSNKWTTLI